MEVKRVKEEGEHDECECLGDRYQMVTIEDDSCGCSMAKLVRT